jgi:hypothetical protein
VYCKEAPLEPGECYPMCRMGKRVYPPEDCAVASGGTRAFWTLYKIRSIPSMRRWWNGSGQV